MVPEDAPWELLLVPPEDDELELDELLLELLEELLLELLDELVVAPLEAGCRELEEEPAS